MKNKLSDLNNHLFAQLERLSEESLTKDADLLEKEIKRTNAVTSVAREIIQNSRTVLDAQVKLGHPTSRTPDMLGIEQK